MAAAAGAPGPGPGASDYHGGVDIGMLTELGRERGPDLQLKIDATVLAFAPGGGTLNIIKQDSSITEVLNVVSYLVYDGSVGGGVGGGGAVAVRNFASMVDTNNSVGAAVGGVDPANGFYNNASTAVTAANDPFLLADAATASTRFISLDTFQLQNQGEARIPVSILRRTGAQDAANNNINKVINDAIANFRKVDVNGANAIPLFSDCVKQMINILIKTREIFGPKGWTDLFQKVKGGGRTGKTHAKRTHRRHRRRYSSKQY